MSTDLGSNVLVPRQSDVQIIRAMNYIRIRNPTEHTVYVTFIINGEPKEFFIQYRYPKGGTKIYEWDQTRRPPLIMSYKQIAALAKFISDRYSF